MADMETRPALTKPDDATEENISPPSVDGARGLGLPGRPAVALIAIFATVVILGSLAQALWGRDRVVETVTVEW